MEEPGTANIGPSAWLFVPGECQVGESVAVTLRSEPWHATDGPQPRSRTGGPDHADAALRTSGDNGSDMGSPSAPRQTKGLDLSSDRARG
jgi:hypothetical protein